VFNLGDAVIT